jgi:asparagine synthase (glutamine-hydrolysing)
MWASRGETGAHGMCGICGAVWTDRIGTLSAGSLKAMMDRLVHRGPDDSGEYRDDHAALGFRRLSIIDLAGGHQPLSNEDGTVWTVFNGEIYNFPTLRRRLEAKGHVLRSSGDTEVLVHLYEDEGTRMFSLLRGMFALVIWDARRRTLVLARDRLGQKPLVYRHDGRRLVFASELKALLALPESDVPRSVDPLALFRPIGASACRRNPPSCGRSRMKVVPEDTGMRHGTGALLATRTSSRTIRLDFVQQGCLRGCDFGDAGREILGRVIERDRHGLAGF